MPLGIGVPFFKAWATHICNIVYFILIMTHSDNGLVSSEVLITWGVGLMLTQVWQLLRGSSLFISWDEKLMAVAGALIVAGLLFENIEGVSYEVAVGCQGAEQEFLHTRTFSCRLSSDMRVPALGI